MNDSSFLMFSFLTMVFEHVVEISLNFMGGFYVKSYVEMPLCGCEQLSDFCAMFLQHEVFFTANSLFGESWYSPLDVYLFIFRISTLVKLVVLRKAGWVFPHMM